MAEILYTCVCISYGNTYLPITQNSISCKSSAIHFLLAFYAVVMNRGHNCFIMKQAEPHNLKALTIKTCPWHRTLLLHGIMLPNYKRC